MEDFCVSSGVGLENVETLVEEFFNCEGIELKSIDDRLNFHTSKSDNQKDEDEQKKIDRQKDEITTNIITISTYLECYFKARDEVSINRIKELDVDRIVEIQKDGSLYDDDKMFDLLQLKPYLLAVKKMEK